jgi:hypothetical protein
MQPAVQLLQAEWQNLLGWMLIVTGTLLAVHTLGFAGVGARASHVVRIYRPAEWCRRQPARARSRPMDPQHQWEKLATIAERGVAQVETIVDLHTRAAQALEAVDAALSGLLAQYGPGKALSPPQHDTQPGPAPAPTPLAA